MLGCSDMRILVAFDDKLPLADGLVFTENEYLW
jgi:hypothetical protein